MPALSVVRLLAVALAPVVLGCGPRAGRAVGRPEAGAASVRDFVRVRCSTDGADTLMAWRGAVHSDVPGEPARHLFDVVGMNVARCLPGAGPDGRSWLLTSREVMLYLAPTTGQRLERWHNPWTGEQVPVVHVANSPIQAELSAAPALTRAGGLATFALAVFPFYPDPLRAVPELAASVAGPSYQSGELFSFTVRAAELGGASAAVPEVALGWTRIGPWLPWMKQGSRPGRLVYSTQGQRVASFSELPALLQRLITGELPLYRSAPRCRLAQPNMTSWRYFAQHHDAYLRGERFPRPAPVVAESCTR